MSINRVPAGRARHALVGDAAGAVNPFNGEGIAYAMETSEIAAELIARGPREGPARHRDDVPHGPATSATATTSASDEASPRSSVGRRSWARRRGSCCPTRKVMGFAMRLMANLTDGKDGDAQDRLFAALERIARVS